MTELFEILLVDDNLADIKLALYSLGAAESIRTVNVVRDGEEALDFLFCRGRYAKRVKTALPRLVLLDLKLPKVTGFEVLEAIRNDADTHDLPIVILTSSNQERDVRECYRLGANSYVQKPVDFDAFRNLLQQIKQYWLDVNRTPMTLTGVDDEPSHH